MAARRPAGGLEDREEVETEDGAERSESVDSLSEWRAGPWTLQRGEHVALIWKEGKRTRKEGRNEANLLRVVERTLRDCRGAPCAAERLIVERAAVTCMYKCACVG